MFIHIFTYRLKCLFRDKELVFWTLLFPLILATFFSMAFSKLNDHDLFNPINVAVVNNDAYDKNEDFKKFLEGLSTGENPILNLTETEEEASKVLLSEDQIDAYILLDSEAQLMIRKPGLNQTIAKIILEEYHQTSTAAHYIFKNTQNMESVISNLSTRLEYTKELPISDVKPNGVLNYFYSLLAMACMYGSFWGLKEIIDIQADLTQRAARVNMSPVHKLKTFIYSSSAALVIQYAEILVLLLYLRFILGIDFGNKIGYVLLTALVGSIMGLTFGAFVSSAVKKGEGVKIAILIGVSMLGSFLAGMMFDKMKYIVADQAPILSLLNPINLLTDAFYCLYYFDTYDRYWLNMGVLGLFILFFSIVTYFIIRRQKYASL